MLSAFIFVGTAQSSITLRDICLNNASHVPIACDDAATLDEDTAATGNVLTNDSTDGTAIARIETLSEPAHGTLTLENDGSFTYMPEADYYGTDSFSYRLVDEQGRVSNTATVTLTVRPVNDAPVAVNLSGELDEDQTLRIDLLASAMDVDGDVLTTQIVAGPAHGSLVANADGSFT